MPFEDVGLWAETIVATGSLMSDSLTGYFFYQHRILLAPLYVIMGLPRHRSVNSASQIILRHMGRTISVTGKRKVGGNANFVLIRKICFAGWIWRAHAPTGQSLPLRNMTNIEPKNIAELAQKLRPADGLEKPLIIAQQRRPNTGLKQ